MRLLQSVLPTLHQTKKPQQKFVAHLLGLLLLLPGHATLRNLSRYSSYHERTFARWYARDFDFVALNKVAITAVIPPEPAQALVIDASFVPKSGKKTYGLDRFWNGSHSRTEKGLEISVLAWLDITDNCAYGLSVEQTPSTGEAPEPETTRIDVYLDQLTHVVSEHHLRHLRYVITDGYYSTQKFLGGVRALGLEQIGKLRIDANLRYVYQGPKRLGPGRPKTYDGKVHWDNLSRFEKVETEDDDIALYHQVLNHVQFQCNLSVVLVVDTKHHRRAVLFSTDVDLDALTIYASSGGTSTHRASVDHVSCGVPPVWCHLWARVPLRHSNRLLPSITLFQNGLFWLVLSLRFEFGFFHYAMHAPWEKLLADYHLFRGRLLSVVWFTTLFSPLICGKLSRGKRDTIW